MDRALPFALPGVGAAVILSLAIHSHKLPIFHLLFADIDITIPTTNSLTMVVDYLGRQ